MYKSRLAFTVSFWVDEARSFCPLLRTPGLAAWSGYLEVKCFGLGGGRIRGFSDFFLGLVEDQKVTPFFGLSRGVWQGCPLSPVLYVLYAEVVACSIRANPAIDRLSLPEAPVPLPVISQYANDTFVIVTSDATIGGTFAT